MGKPDLILPKNLQYILFFIGVSVFLFYRAGFVFYSTAMRSQPVEVDDSYVYTWKAVTMANCFLNDCHAQNDLRNQVFIPAADKKTELIRRRTAGELFIFSTPLHSMILCLLHNTGLNWLNAYRTLVVIGIFFICCALTYWLFMTWGPMAAGISLIFISPMIFEAQGLQMVVPSNLALGIGALTWGRISQAGHRTWLALPLCSTAALMMHPIGKVYAAVGLGIYIIVVGRKMSYKNVLCALITVGILATAFLVPYFVDRPLMDYNRFTKFADYNWIEGVKGNISAAFGSFGSGQFIKNMALIGAGLGAFLLVFSTLDVGKKRQVIATGILLGLLGLASLFYVVPSYHAELFHRIWIPVVAFFSGAYAHLLCDAMGVIFKQAKRAFRILAHKDPRNRIHFSGLFDWKQILSMILGVVFLGGLVWQLVNGTPKLIRRLDVRIKKHPFTLDQMQPSKLLGKASHEEKVLYTDEIPMLFHLVNGTHKFGAIYYPAIRNSSIEGHWMKKIDYIVGWNNPFRKLAMEGERYPPVLLFANINTITYESMISEDLGKLEVFISNPGESFDVDISVRSPESDVYSEPTFQFRVPARYEGWLSPSAKLSDYSINCFQLMPTRVNEKATLMGLRFSNGSVSTVWPWKQRAKITVNYKVDKQVSACFNVLDTLGSKELRSYFESHPESLNVIMDTGSIVLLHKVNTKKRYEKIGT